MTQENTEWEQFKSCLKIQSNLDLEAWDVMLFQPLKDLSAWWSRQSDATKLWSTFLSGVAGTAFARWIGGVAKIASTEIAGLLSESIVAVLAGLAFGTFMDAVGRCIIQRSNV